METGQRPVALVVRRLAAPLLILLALLARQAHSIQEAPGALVSSELTAQAEPVALVAKARFRPDWLAVSVLSSSRIPNMAKPPRVSLDPNASAYKSPDDAADDVSKGFLDPKNPQQGERIAVIVKRPDGMYSPSTVTEPQGGDSSALAIGLPQGYALAGIVHSHPGRDATSREFSQDDIDTANALKVPSFIRFARDGSIAKFVPGQSKVFNVAAQDMHGNNTTARASYGDPITPTQTNVNPDAQ